LIKNSRSPLKDKPLRNPGQSLDEQIRDAAEDHFVPLTFVVFVLILPGLP
jgi:hypothetical protein